MGLRQKRAQLLGYANHAHLPAANGMEKSPGSIQAALDDLLSRMSPTRDTLISSWKQSKQDDLKARREVDDGKFYAWDRAYYSKFSQ